MLSFLFFIIVNYFVVYFYFLLVVLGIKVLAATVVLELLPHSSNDNFPTRKRPIRSCLDQGMARHPFPYGSIQYIGHLAHPIHLGSGLFLGRVPREANSLERQIWCHSVTCLSDPTKEGGIISLRERRRRRTYDVRGVVSATSIVIIIIIIIVVARAILVQYMGH